jgi:hypothetical protein
MTRHSISPTLSGSRLGAASTALPLVAALASANLAPPGSVRSARFLVAVTGQ